MFSTMGVTPIDLEARKLLFDMHWTSKGWRPDDQRVIAPQDLAYAKDHGLMADPLTIEHDALVDQLRAAAAALTLDQVRDAFLASLSTQRADLRSALATYTLASSLRPHAFTRTREDWRCQHCRAPAREDNEDINVLQFERHKWGGVRHDQPIYQLVDLTSLARSLPATPEPEDHAIFAAILRTIAATPATAGPTKLVKALKEVVPGNESERGILLEILALAGILVAKEERGHQGDWSHVGSWRGSDGYDREAVTRIFGANAMAVKPAKKLAAKKPAAKKLAAKKPAAKKPAAKKPAAKKPAAKKPAAKELKTKPARSPASRGRSKPRRR